MSIKQILVILPLLVTGFALPAAAQFGAWTAEFYNNPELDGQPVVIRSEESPRGSWGKARRTRASRRTSSPCAGRPGCRWKMTPTC